VLFQRLDFQHYVHLVKSKRYHMSYICLPGPIQDCTVPAEQKDPITISHLTRSLQKFPSKLLGMHFEGRLLNPAQQLIVVARMEKGNTDL
jgi:hypothetical protein